MADKKITRRLSIFINGQEVDNTLSNIRKNLTKFRAAANRATEGTEDWKKYNKIVAELETELDNNIKAQKSFRKAAKETASGLDQDKEAINNFTQSFGELFQGIKSGDFLQIQNGFSGIKSGIVGATKASMAFIATPIGAAIAGLFAIGVAAKKWIDYNAAVVKSLGLTKQITQLTDGAADQVRVRGEAISEIFGLEFQGTLEKARALVKKFGISYDEAFDVIQDNLIRGQKNNDEFFQSLDEYAVFFSKAQFTADEFGKIIAAGYDLGFYNDKLPDAIKEFALTIEEQTQPAKDALINAFGPKFTKQLLTGIRDGSISVKDALAQISEEANKAGLNVQQQQQLTADLFKGAGEDAGGALKIFEAVNTALNEQTRALSESEQITQDQVKATTELKQISSALFVSGDKGFGLLKDRAKLFLTEGIIKILRGGVDLMNWFIELNNTSAIFSGIIQTIGAIATAQFEVIMSLLNNAKLGFSGLGDIITGAFTLDPDKISEGFAKTNAATALFFKDIVAKGKSAAVEIGEAFAGNNQIDRVSLDDFTSTDDGSNSTSNGSSNTANEGLTPSDQKILDSKKKLAELLDEFAAERKLQEELKKLEESERAEQEELLRLESKFAKLEADANGEKDLLERLEIEKQALITGIREKHDTIRAKKEAEATKRQNKLDKKQKEALVAAENDLARAKQEALQAGISALLSFADKSSAIYKALFVAEKAAAAGSIITNGIKERARILAETPDPTGAITTARVLASKIRTGVNLADLAATTISSFAQGGDTGFGNRGLGSNSGGYIRGVVEEGEYVVPRIVRRDPEVPRIIDYLEAKRTGKSFADGGDADISRLSNTAEIDNSEMLNMMARVATVFEKLNENGIQAHANIGEREIRRLDEENKEIKNQRELAKINN